MEISDLENREKKLKNKTRPMVRKFVKIRAHSAWALAISDLELNKKILKRKK
jgi:hypothetical protein